MASVIILTQYYPPETGAPQNRLHSLAKYLKQSGHEICVVTALPNYPKNEIFNGYKDHYSVRETIDDIPVHRRWIFVSRSRSVIARLFNYFSFVVTSFFALLRLPKGDYIICESPPLFLGITAVLISRIKGSRLVFNVSDLWPESAEKLHIISNRFLINLSYRLEHWIYRNAFIISGQTKGIVKSIQDRFPSKKVVWFPNGVDVDFFDGLYELYNWRQELNFSEDDFVLLYAGIIGHAQGLDVILQAAEHMQELSVRFLVVGDGPEKERLMAIAYEKKLLNVFFLPNLPKSKIPSLIHACDAYIVPLKKLDLFKGAIPSKLFEPLSMGKPILLGVNGEAKELFIDEGKSGLYFEPENAAALVTQLKTLYEDRTLVETLGKSGKRYVETNFDRNHIHERFLKDIES
ncbi:MAG: glycosyltransferase family 4 protein [Cyclobacteriaceae bacterium]